jgi:hypothetical protein
LLEGIARDQVGTAYVDAASDEQLVRWEARQDAVSSRRDE